MKMKGLRKLREAHGLRQADIASMLNVNITTYQHYETPHSLPPTYVLPRLAEIFSMTVEELMGWDDVLKKAAGTRPVIRHEHDSNAWTCPHCKSRNLIDDDQLKKYAQYRKKGGENDLIDVYCKRCLHKSIVQLGTDTVYYVKGVEL